MTVMFEMLRLTVGPLDRTFDPMTYFANDRELCDPHMHKARLLVFGDDQTVGFDCSEKNSRPSLIQTATGQHGHRKEEQLVIWPLRTCVQYSDLLPELPKNHFAEPWQIAFLIERQLSGREGLIPTGGSPSIFIMKHQYRNQPIKVEVSFAWHVVPDFLVSIYCRWLSEKDYFMGGNIFCPS